MVVSNLVFHDKRLSWKNSGHLSGMQLMSIKIGLLSVLLLKTCVRKKGGLGGFAPQTLTRSYYFEPPLSKKRSRATVVRYDAEACNERRGPSSRLSACATHLWRNIAAVASRWRVCTRFDRPRFPTPNLPNREHCLKSVSKPPLSLFLLMWNLESGIQRNKVLYNFLNLV